MDAYVFGAHQGELPTSLVGAGDEGNRIRAAARLQGGHPDVFYALQVGSSADVQQHVDELAKAGTETLAVVLADPSEAAIYVQPLPHPAFLPPGLWTAFVHAVGDAAAPAVEVLLDLLGDGNVAAVRLDDGSVLIEVTGSDRDELASAIDRALQAGSLTEQIRGFAAQDEFHRAT